ncbi:MAG: 50S ribosomal protein L22 [Candidatus Micrarchaeota archaeon]
MANRYTYQVNEKKTARALSKDQNLSAKHCNEICHAIKGMSVDKAISYLKKVIDKEDFVPFRRYNTGVGHRKGGTPGRYPQRAAKIVIKTLENLRANAENLELEPEKMKIIQASAFKTANIHRIKPKGRVKTQNIELARIEIVAKQT